MTPGKLRELKRTRSDTTRVLDRTSLASPRDPHYAGGEGRVDLELPTMSAPLRIPGPVALRQHSGNAT